LARSLSQGKRGVWTTTRVDLTPSPLIQEEKEAQIFSPLVLFEMKL